MADNKTRIDLIKEIQSDISDPEYFRARLNFVSRRSSDLERDLDRDRDRLSE